MEELDQSDISDAEIFASIMGDSKAAEPAPMESAEDDKTARDEKGRFAATEATPPQEPAAPVEAPEEPLVPSFRLREQTEKLKAAEERAERLEREKQELLKSRQPAQPVAEPEDDDDLLYTNPKAWKQAILDQFEAKQFQQADAISRDIVSRDHKPEELNKMLSTLQERAANNDPVALAIEANIAASTLPWVTLVQSYKQYEAVFDPDGYKQRLIAEHMAQSQPAPAARPSSPNVIDLPPSLSKARGSASFSSPSGDMSDADIWKVVATK